MPSAFTHGFVAVALGKTFTGEKMPAKFWALAVLCSVIPDIDIIGFYFGIRYRDMLGHRGFLHSLSFALLLGVIVVALAFPEVRAFSKKWRGLFAFFFIVTASHGLLDAMTNGGYGIGFFIPFDRTRHFLPWRIMQVSPISVSVFFTQRGIAILLNEILWVWVPAMLLYTAVYIYRAFWKRIRLSV